MCELSRDEYRSDVGPVLMIILNFTPNYHSHALALSCYVSESKRRRDIKPGVDGCHCFCA